MLREVSGEQEEQEGRTQGPTRGSGPAGRARAGAERPGGVCLRPPGDGLPPAATAGGLSRGRGERINVLAPLAPAPGWIGSETGISAARDHRGGTETVGRGKRRQADGQPPAAAPAPLPPLPEGFGPRPAHARGSAQPRTRGEALEGPRPPARPAAVLPPLLRALPARNHRDGWRWRQLRGDGRGPSADTRST